MKRYTVIIGLALLMLPLVMPVNAAGLAKGKSENPPFLSGNRIIVWDDDIWVPADEPSYVHHGCRSELWKDLTPEEKRTYLDRETYVFELYIDGVQVDLRLSYHPYFSDGAHEDSMIVWYSVQFDANAFAQSSAHIFEGSWYDHGALVVTKTITVHFT